MSNIYMTSPGLINVQPISRICNHVHEFKCHLVNAHRLDMAPYVCFKCILKINSVNR